MIVKKSIAIIKYENIGGLKPFAKKIIIYKDRRTKLIGLKQLILLF